MTATTIQFGVMPWCAGTRVEPTVRGQMFANNGEFYAMQSLPTDPIGTFYLTLTGLVIGSAIQVEDQAGTTTLANLVADTTTEVITLSAYAPGSPLNDLRIKVRKGSAAPYYRPFETLATAIVGSTSIFVSQIADD